MSREWKRQAMAAAAALVILFGAAAAHSAVMIARCRPNDAAEETEAPRAARWGTITQTAATHDGPGLRYAMTGMMAAGHAVEVVRMQDGWCKCRTYLRSEPVWIAGEYLALQD